MVLSKGLLYISRTPKREVEGVLAFLALQTTSHAVLAVITKDQTAKTIAKVLYERFITVFSMPAKLLSDWGGAKFHLSAG